MELPRYSDFVSNLIDVIYVQRSSKDHAVLIDPVLLQEET